MDCGKSGAIPRAAPRGARALSVRPSPRHRGTQEQEHKHRHKLLLLRQGLPRSALQGSLSAAASRRRKSPQGRAQDARAFAVSTRTYCQRTSGAPLRSLPGMDARQTAAARVPFSWLLLFGQAKRSNSSARMADEAHRDVSRSSREREGQKARAGSRPSPG